MSKQQNPNRNLMGRILTGKNFRHFFGSNAHEFKQFYPETIILIHSSVQSCQRHLCASNHTIHVFLSAQFHSCLGRLEKSCGFGVFTPNVLILRCRMNCVHNLALDGYE